MPASDEAYDHACACVSPIPGEDAVLLRPRDPQRIVREVFHVLLRYGGLSRDTRAHLVRAFRAAQMPALERRLVAATSERWDAEHARALAETLADAWCSFEPAVAYDTDTEAVLS